MTCLTAQVLGAHLDGELTQNEIQAATVHLAGCAECRQQLSQMQRAIAALPSAFASREDAGFITDVLTKLPAVERARFPWGGRLALAAVAVAVLALIPVIWVPSGEFTARGSGGGSLSSQAQGARGLGFSAWVHPASTPMVRHPVASRETIHPEDGFSFELRNRTDKPVFAALLAIDSQGETHWFYPSWQTGGDPMTVQVPQAPAVLALPEGVTPENLAAGDLQLVGVFLDQPVHISELERLLQAGGLTNLRAHLPLATVQTVGLNAAEATPK